MGRVLDLANSSATKYMVADFAADICQALKMEHVSGEGSDTRFDSGEDDSTVGSGGTEVGSAVGDACGNVCGRNTDGTSGAEAAAEVRVHGTPITQADLYCFRNRGLRISSPAFAAATASPTLPPFQLPAAPSLPPPADSSPSRGDGAGVRVLRSGSATASPNMVGGSGAEAAGTSTPSTPIGRLNWSGANPASAAMREAAPAGSAGGGRPRSESDSVVMLRRSMRTPVPILRGTPVPFERRLLSPALRSVERALHDASRRYPEVGRDDQLPEERRRVTGTAHGIVSHNVQNGGGARPEAGSDRGDVNGIGVSSRPAGRWLQRVVVIIILLFAFDGLRHRLFSNRRATPLRTSVSRSSFSARTAQSNGVLPWPTCQDPDTGATMRIWATPRGACLSLEEKASGDAEVGGGFSPTCGVEFTLCSAHETARVA